MSGAIALALWPPQRDDFSRLPAFSREEQRQQELAAQVRASRTRTIGAARLGRGFPLGRWVTLR